MWRRGFTVLVIGLGISTAACAARTPTTSESKTIDRYVITSAELEKAKELTLYEAISRLRPHFLRSRTAVAYGKEASVPVHLYVDGDKMESLDDLRRLSPASAQEVRFYEPQIANTVFAGQNNAGGVIAVITKTTGG